MSSPRLGDRETPFESPGWVDMVYKSMLYPDTPWDWHRTADQLTPGQPPLA